MSTPIHTPEWTSGSPKQQAWATELRQHVVDWTAIAVELYSQPRPADHPLANDRATIEMDRKIAIALPEALAKVMSRFTEPRWWIDTQGGHSINAVAVEVSRRVDGASFGNIITRVRRDASR